MSQVTEEQRQRMLGFYGAIRRWLAPAVARVSSRPDTTLDRAREVFVGMLDELPYVDRPEHTMANSAFACAAMLAVFEVLRDAGVDAHAWGRSIHALPSAAGDDSEEQAEAARERSRRDAEASQRDASANEFEFEIVDADAAGDRGMNITSCAICHLFGRRGAMELVPYMCAFDDVVSDANGQGLRRTGTLALGATHCDFRFRKDGEPLRLAAQYPDRIRLDEI